MWQVMQRLLRRPIYAMSVTFVLGIGLGSAYCLYGIVDSVLFRPLQVADADRVVRIFRTNESAVRDNWSRENILQQLATVDAFESVAFYADWVQVTYETSDRQHEMTGAVVSGNYFALMRVQPLAGRLLQVPDAVRGAAPVAVLSAEVWRNHFNANEEIIGQGIRINGELLTVVGVAPPGFSGVSLEAKVDVWMPMSLANMALSGFSLDMLFGANVSWLDVVARLAPGISASDAQQALDTRRLARAEDEEKLAPTLVLPAREVAVDPDGERGTRNTSWVLLGLVGVLLLVVWSDVVGLMLVRAETQRAETAVRMSLGATRLRVAADALAESAAIAAAAGLLAALTGYLFARWLISVAGDDLGIAVDAGSMLFNARTLTAFGAMLVLTVVLTSLAPMRRLARTILTVALRNAHTDSTQRVVGMRDMLVALQIGVSLVLLTAATMFVGSLRATMAIDPGFSIANRAVARISLNNNDDEKQAYRAILEGLRNDGRVQNAALVLFAPVNDSGLRADVKPQDYSAGPGEDPDVDVLPVSDGFFRTMGIEMLRGRDIDPRQVADDTRQVVVNQAFADRYWPGRSVLGLALYEFMSEHNAEVVGVVANHKQRDLHGKPLPIVYAPAQSMFVTGLEIVVEASSAELALAAIRDVTVREAPGSSLIQASTLQGRMDDITARDRAITTVAGGSAVFATLLAIVGMYGIAAFSVRHRQREIGIRYSLGATRGKVVLRFLRRGALVAAAGIVLGSLSTLVLAPGFAGTMSGVNTVPITELLLVAILLSTIAILANLVPVWRAAGVAPMEVLRDE
ncbi:MAG: ABC transporter permease [Woeseia sp.]